MSLPVTMRTRAAAPVVPSSPSVPEPSDSIDQREATAFASSTMSPISDSNAPSYASSIVPTFQSVGVSEAALVSRPALLVLPTGDGSEIEIDTSQTPKTEMIVMCYSLISKLAATVEGLKGNIEEVKIANSSFQEEVWKMAGLFKDEAGSKEAKSSLSLSEAEVNENAEPMAKPVLLNHLLSKKDLLESTIEGLENELKALQGINMTLAKAAAILRIDTHR